MALASEFMVVATPKPGVSLERLLREIDDEIARIAASPPTPVEVERARSKIVAGAVFGLEAVGGFGGRAATLANYTVRTGDPGYLERTWPATARSPPADVSRRGPDLPQARMRGWCSRSCRGAGGTPPSPSARRGR